MEVAVDVTHSNMSAKINRVNLYKKFTTNNNLHEDLDKIVLLDKEGEEFCAKLKKDDSKSRGSAIYGGWRNFCLKNNFEDGDSCLFELIQVEGIRAFQLLTYYKKKEQEQLDSSYVTFLVTHTSFNDGKQHIPIGFMRDNNLTKGMEVTLVAKNGEDWAITINVKKCYSRVYWRIKSPLWKEFCVANGVRAGQYITLKLITKRGKLMLKFFDKN